MDSTLAHRIARLDWRRLSAQLDEHGFATLSGLLTTADSRTIADLYSGERPFRSRVVMSRHGFGRGEYRYFAYPLPDLVAMLRAELYPPLASIANQWNEALGFDARFPPEHQTYLERCRAASQTKPTPLLLRYAPGDFNCLHQDLYGEEIFPLQVTILLSAPGVDFTGGEFILTEQRPRMQSRVEVVPLSIGGGVIFPVRHRPVRGAHRPHRVTMRHGVSRIRAGERFALGIVFHDAR